MRQSWGSSLLVTSKHCALHDTQLTNVDTAITCNSNFAQTRKVTYHTVQAMPVSVHPIAASGFGGAGLDAYIAARPTYPPEALEHCIKQLGLQRGAHVLDLAAGTGKLTKVLVDMDLFDIVAAEPSAGMCDGFRRTCPGVRIEQAEAASLPFGDASFDAVFVAQAFHCE